MGLGAFLCYKGVDFLINMHALQQLLAANKSFGSFSVYMLGHVIAFAHIAGGLLLIMGVLTRFACIIQIPILLGAVFFFNLRSEVFRPHSEVIISIVVLLLLVYFLIVGNGPWSVKLPPDEEDEKRTARYL